MAKDILVNTNTGDLQLAEANLQQLHYDVVWGKLFDSDGMDYMNIVVPVGYVNNVSFTSGEYQCLVQASYSPINSRVLARLVVYNKASDTYTKISQYTTNAPGDATCIYYPTYTGVPEYICPCQFPIVNIDGYFHVTFTRFGGSDFTFAVISSSAEMDFSIGDSDSQSAQLLMRCAPGKSYRYPTTGVDLTKYINSVVEHTDLTDKLLSEFEADSKELTDAEFESSTGDLQVQFSGTNEANDTNLTAIADLDTTLFDVADDDFIKKVYRAAHAQSADCSDFIDSLSLTSDYVAIYDIGNAAAMIVPTVTELDDGYIDNDGRFIEDDSAPYIGYQINLIKNRVYADCYERGPYSFYNSSTQLYHAPILFTILDDDNNVVYHDPSFWGYKGEYSEYILNHKNHQCFIPLKDNLKLIFLVESGDIYPIRLLQNIKGNYASLVGYTIGSKTGNITAITSTDTSIQGIQQDLVTNQIIAIK